tara:strand:- start:201 stop:614 length:414 start_codon:yes stop_codon:yes gene_type:complete
MTARFAVANDIPFKVVDGNDVCSIYNAAADQISAMRSGGGPMLLELVTYRHYGHVDWRDDIDVGVERSLDDVDNWKQRDPILRLSKSLFANNIWSKDEEDSFYKKLDQDIETAWEQAMRDPYPSKDATLDHVYYSKT